MSPLNEEYDLEGVSEEDIEKRQELMSRFKEMVEEGRPSSHVIIDPSIFVSERSFNNLRSSEILSESDVRIYVSEEFMELLQARERFDPDRYEAWKAFARRAERSEPGEVLSFIKEQQIESYSINQNRETHDEIYSRLEWEHALDGLRDNVFYRDILRDQLDFLLSARWLGEETKKAGKYLISRTSDTFDRWRDAGVPTIDFGKAPLTTEFKEKLENVGHRKHGKYAGIVVAEGVALIDPIFGAIAGTSVGILSLKFDP